MKLELLLVGHEASHTFTLVIPPGNGWTDNAKKDAAYKAQSDMIDTVRNAAPKHHGDTIMQRMVTYRELLRNTGQLQDDWMSVPGRVQNFLECGASASRMSMLINELL